MEHGPIAGLYMCFMPLFLFVILFALFIAAGKDNDTYHKEKMRQWDIEVYYFDEERRHQERMALVKQGKCSECSCRCRNGSCAVVEGDDGQDRGEQVGRRGRSAGLEVLRLEVPASESLAVVQGRGKRGRKRR